MADMKIRVACAQAGILNIYDPGNSLVRAQEIYDVAHPAYISAPSEKAIEDVERLILKYQEQIDKCKPGEMTQQSSKLRAKLRELEKLVALSNRKCFL
ncbi:MAG: hypothetical protein MUF61_02690 [archaeon]|nr:hypothetical protein [archaeon]